MSSILVIGIIAALGGGVYWLGHKDSPGFQLLYPAAFKTEVESAFAMAMDRLKPLGHKKHGTVRVIVKKGNEKYGDMWGFKKPNGNLVGAQVIYRAGNQTVELYTDPAGFEQPSEILHEMGHVVLNFDKTMAYEPGTVHHEIMHKYGFPHC